MNISKNQSNWKSCVVALPRVCNSATLHDLNATHSATAAQPDDIRASAVRVLQRNSERNKGATAQKMKRNFPMVNGSQALRYREYGISLKEIESEAENDWGEIMDNPAAIEAFACLLYERKLMRQGIVPESFAASTNCQGCGLVPVPRALAKNRHVWGCPWCWNRANGWPIPTQGPIGPPAVNLGEYANISTSQKPLLDKC